MFRVQLNTEIENHGTAIKVIELPFVPFVGLEVKEKDIEVGTVLDEYTVDCVAWDVPSQSFKCRVWFGLGEQIEVKMKSLASRGWMEL
jgi:hypothetical protein